MVMSEFIKNLDVTFEIVSPIKDIDFHYSPVAEVKSSSAKSYRDKSKLPLIDHSFKSGTSCTS
jgi:hypothetical protein